nr:MAG: glycoprotein [Mononegavirales sp.]
MKKTNNRKNIIFPTSQEPPSRTAMGHTLISVLWSCLLLSLALCQDEGEVSEPEEVDPSDTVTRPSMENMLKDLFVPPEEDKFQGDPKKMTVYPERLLSNWTICQIEDLQCPKKVRQMDFPKSGVKSLALWPLKGLSSVVEGYICKAVMMSRSCWTNFLGAQTVNGSEHVLHPSVSDCKMEISRAEKGIYQAPIWPEHVCAWMATKTVTIKQIELTRKALIFDHLANAYFGAPLKDNKCNKPPCETSVMNILWFPSGEPVGVLNEEDLLRCKAKEDENRTLYLKCPHQPYLRFSMGACRFMYGGHVGLRSEEGIGMIWSGSKKFLKHLKGKTCKEKGLKVYQWSAHKEIDFKTAEVEDDELHNRCLDATSRIRDAGKISQWDLGYYYPSSPGPFTAFRLSQESQKLECAKYLFSEKRIASKEELLRVLDPGAIGRALVGGDRQGINGLVITKANEVYIPHLVSSRTINWGEHVNPEDIVEVKSHKTLKSKELIEIDSIPDLSDLATGEAVQTDGWSNVWAGIMEKLAWISIGLFISMIISGLFLWCCPICLKKTLPKFKQTPNRSLFRH